jgi:hypothetical protein
MDDQNDPYYRIYNSGDDWNIVTMQWFDEYDYDQSKFYSDTKFLSYEQADQFMQKHHIGLYKNASPIRNTFTLSELISFLKEKEKIAGKLPVMIETENGPMPVSITIMDNKGGYDLTKFEILLLHQQK